MFYKIKVLHDTSHLLLLTILLAFIFVATTTYATEVPNLIHYEGYLTKKGSNKGKNTQSVQDGFYDLTFSIYDSTTSTTPLWTETWDTTTTQVLVSKGHFRVFLGTHTPLSPKFFQEHPNTWLGITIDPNQTMLPRQRIASVPYAMSTYSDEPPFPSGGIIMWSGEIADIPNGWALCDGTNSTPDLRDRFVIGAGGSKNPGQKGGDNTHTHTISISSGSGTTGSAGSHAHHMDFEIHKDSCIDDCKDGADDGDKKVGSDSHGHRIVGDTEPHGSHTHSVSDHNHNANISSGYYLPAFYALAYIMKL